VDCASFCNCGSSNKEKNLSQKEEKINVLYFPFYKKTTLLLFASGFFIIMCLVLSIGILGIIPIDKSDVKLLSGSFSVLFKVV